MHQQPSSSTTPTTSSLYRFRWGRPLPCTHCRAINRKCTLEQPTCLRCQEKGLPCVYSAETPTVAKRKEPKRAKACTECHGHKRRCDLAKPSCTGCVTRGLHCNYSLNAESQVGVRLRSHRRGIYVSR
ncbi:hypothetical protein BCR33DRAFT_337717 [Rhizoclosmatium globosum]|uniref:Zn(2)-C6 fungal-type domain-containing protein n=1 Tax=Rhizoclosmatium globosum TaxID=329046 RepID=A0A1Y2C3P6_9FUNG|nr:hypothetical protein BCR33DRAFT_337717 [Rhizoclosmatium globosum]|eukprot:ORY41673.1 hypothetical protein BCR33DRAFT_337717 [Rhizoclosmatium globosum]